MHHRQKKDNTFVLIARDTFSPSSPPSLVPSHPSPPPPPNSITLYLRFRVRFCQSDQYIRGERNDACLTTLKNENSQKEDYFTGKGLETSMSMASSRVRTIGAKPVERR